MNPALAALAVGVVAGGVVAVSARDARISIVGLAVALVFAPMLADPFPNGQVLAARVVAAVLAVYLLWIVARDGFDVRHARLRSPVEVLIALAAGLAGFSSGALTPPPLTEVATVGVPVARGAAFAIAALAVIPILEGRDSLRLGTGLLLAVLAAALLQQGMGQTPAPITQLAFAAVMVGVAATSAGLGALALRAAERADRPVRAGAHPLGPIRDGGGGQLRLGAQTAEAALRRRLARARVPERLATIRSQSRGAMAGVRSARSPERAVGDVRRRLERPEAPARPQAALPTDRVAPRKSAKRPVEPAASAEPAAAEPAAAEPAAAEPAPSAPTPATIGARSAGARRSLPRRE